MLKIVDSPSFDLGVLIVFIACYMFSMHIALLSAMCIETQFFIVLKKTIVYISKLLVLLIKIKSGLDGEIHIILLKSGVVVKKCVQGRPIHSLEFIKGTQKLVFLTDSAVKNVHSNNHSNKL